MKLKDIEKLCENAIGPGLFGLVNVHVGVLQKLVAVAKAAGDPYLEPSSMPSSEEHDAYARLQAALAALESE